MSEFSLTDPNWRIFPFKRLRFLGIYSNELWHNPSTNVTALVIKRSRNEPEYEPLTWNALHHLAAALQAGKIAGGIVALVDPVKRTTISQRPVADVAADVRGVPLCPWGNSSITFYCWRMKLDLTPYDPRGRKLRKDTDQSVLPLFATINNK
jgi:hypothetical protein